MFEKLAWAQTRLEKAVLGGRAVAGDAGARASALTHQRGFLSSLNPLSI